MSSIRVIPEKISFNSRLDIDGELRLEVVGEIEADPRRRYDRAVLEFVVLDGAGKIVVRDEATVDLDYMVEGRVKFSCGVYVKAAQARAARSVECRLQARSLEVDRAFEFALEPQART